jgi:isochorismate pyruvate lyase
MKTPEECTNLNDVREAIDQIDHEIITLIGTRAKYVQAAAAFKTSQTTVKAADRVTAMLLTRRKWAADVGISPDVIEKLYTDLVDYFTQEELHQWKKQAE